MVAHRRHSSLSLFLSLSLSSFCSRETSDYAEAAVGGCGFRGIMISRDRAGPETATLRTFEILMGPRVGK
mgnify:CR=1 FL=1